MECVWNAAVDISGNAQAEAYDPQQKPKAKKELVKHGFTVEESKLRGKEWDTVTMWEWHYVSFKKFKASEFSEDASRCDKLGLVKCGKGAGCASKANQTFQTHFDLDQRDCFRFPCR